MTEQPADQEPADQEPATAEEADSDQVETRDAGPARTGVPAADAAAERLSELDEAPLEEHVEVYEDVHRRLQEGLADLDEQ